MYWIRKNWIKKIGSKNLSPKKMLSKKCWLKIQFKPKKIWGPKTFWIQKILGTKILGKKIWL